jgi:hypothetical protein
VVAVDEMELAPTSKTESEVLFDIFGQLHVLSSTPMTPDIELSIYQSAGRISNTS